MRTIQDNPGDYSGKALSIIRASSLEEALSVANDAFKNGELHFAAELAWVIANDSELRYVYSQGSATPWKRSREKDETLVDRSRLLLFQIATDAYDADRIPLAWQSAHHSIYYGRCRYSKLAFTELAHKIAKRAAEQGSFAIATDAYRSAITVNGTLPKPIENGVKERRAQLCEEFLKLTDKALSAGAYEDAYQISYRAARRLVTQDLDGAMVITDSRVIDNFGNVVDNALTSGHEKVAVRALASKLCHAARLRPFR